MGGISIELTLDDVAGASGLARLEERLADRRPLFAQLAGYLEASTLNRFDTQTGPDGKRWKPSIRAQLRGGQTLVDHGLYRQSFTSDHGEDFAAAGTADQRAKILSFGGVIRAVRAKALFFKIPGGGAVAVKAVTIPARPVLGVDAEDRVEIGEIIRDYVSGATA